MLSNLFFLVGTLLLSLNFVEILGLPVSDWFFFAALGLMLLETISIEGKNLKVWTKNKFLLPAWLILLGGIFSIYNSKDHSLAAFEIIQYMYVITLFVSMIWVMVRRGKADWVIYAFIISGVFTVSIALIDYFTGSTIGPLLSNNLERNLWYRFAGTLGHPNKFGYFLVLTSLLTLSRVSSEKHSFPRALLLLFTGMQIFGIYLSGSVTAYIGLTIGGLALFLTTMRSPYKLINLLIILSLLFLLVLSLGELTGLNRSLFNLNDSNVLTRSILRVQTTTSSTRLEIYMQSLENIIRSPIIGVGFDQISTSGISDVEREFERAVHNIFLQTWYAGGIFAFVGYLLISIRLGLDSLKVLSNIQKGNLSPILAGPASAVLAILLMDQFQDSIYQREKWLVIGLLAGHVWEYFNRK